MPKSWLMAAAPAVLALLLLLVLPGAALGHGETSPFIRTVVDTVGPRSPALSVTTEAGGAAALQVVNRGRAELEVIAPGGEPFLRIGPRGTFANVSSLAWYRSGNPDGVGTLPRGIRPGSPPRFVRVSRQPGWTWYDHRLHPAPIAVPPDLARSQRRQRLSDWSVPVRVGGRPGAIAGHIEYRPVLGSVVAALASPAQAAPGVLLYVLPGRVPGLYLENGGRRPVVVRGRAGEPFARVGPEGVEVNVRSPSHQDDQRLSGVVPSVASDPDAPPRWRLVAEEPRYTWLETRALYAPEQPPDVIVEKRVPTVLRRWSVPLETGDRRAEVAGTTSWVPAARPGAAPGRGGDEAVQGISTAVALGAAAALGVALLGALLIRRRRA